ncbi:hypothetical protein [Rhizobium sp. BR 362]|uniref:hypothetical protein n=1 Tax=Rhizobium sp. BR 362 TaxID=3040670 RepID=UPI002F3E7E86
MAALEIDWSNRRTSCHCRPAQLPIYWAIFLIPDVVGPNLPQEFTEFSALGDFATGVSAMLSMAAVSFHPMFWVLVILFNGWASST